MKKKILYVVLLILLATLCLGVLSSCSSKAADFFEYSEDNLGVIGKLVSWMHKGIKNYGWTVVVFTVCLKVLMLPLDFWQRYSSRKSTLKMQRIQPLVEAIDKRYGANTQRANEEKQKLFKKQGYSMASMCLPMILSMVIFFVMFGGLRNYSTYSTIRSYKEMSSAYYNTYVEEIFNLKDGEFKAVYEEYNQKLADAKDEKTKIRVQTDIIGRANDENKAKSAECEQIALEAVRTTFDSRRESWLWIHNVWQPDTWATVMPPYSGNMFNNGFSSSVNMDDYPGGEVIYNRICDAVLSGDNVSYGKNGTWNGLMILPFMSIGLSFLSMFVTQRLERKNRNGETVQQNRQQSATNKTMMILMPLLMAWFGFIYTGAFAIYMVVNYTLSIISTLAMRIPVEKVVLKKLDKDDKKNQSSKASYMR